MILRRLFFFIAFFYIAFACGKGRTIVCPGAMQTDQYFPLLKGHRIGIIANQTSLIGSKHLVDSLKSAGFDIRCVFAPEHGFRGKASAGEEIANAVDSATGIKIISIYGKKLRPSKDDVKDIDLMLFDIQDVGVRFFTYISTLQFCMESCAEYNIPLIVLDRPNPHGFYIDGPVLERQYSSFIGKQPVPVVYGMTIGEYAMMLNGEGWLNNKEKCNLKVIPINNYLHNSLYALPVPPSPNLPDMDAVYLYPSICFFEGTRVSLGRGTDRPFRLIGYPGFEMNPVSFKPKNIPGVASHPPYEDTLCYGVDLTRKGYKVVRQPGIDLSWLLQMYKRFPDKKNFFTSFFENLAGTDKLRQQIEQNKTEAEIKASWKPAIDEFKKIRKKYLLYTDFE